MYEKETHSPINWQRLHDIKIDLAVNILGCLLTLNVRHVWPKSRLNFHMSQPDDVCKRYKYGVVAIQHQRNRKIYAHERWAEQLFSFMNEKPWRSFDVFVRVLCAPTSALCEIRYTTNTSRKNMFSAPNTFWRSGSATDHFHKSARTQRASTMNNVAI